MNFADSFPVGAAPQDVIASFERRARRIETPCGDGSLVWRVWGSGPPVVLTHGSHGAWSHWIRNVDALARDHTVVAVDLPGMGESAMPDREDHATIVDVMATGLRTVVTPTRPVDMIGFSFGGLLAAHLAARHPDLVRRLILVDTGGLNTPLGNIEIRRGVGKLEGEERRAALRGNLLGMMLHHPDSVDELALHIHELNGFRGRLNTMPLVLPAKLLEVLPQLTMQVDAIWGEHDRPHPNPPTQEAVIRGVHPDVAFHVIRDAGHWVMYERPAAFNRIVLDLLAQPLRRAR
jgi:pimeloyl-ACP methyl ester carboxylesterase